MKFFICHYSFAKIDVELALHSDFVRTERLSYEQVAFHEPSNFWIGPRAADLIHLGAKFAPCMRHDPGIMRSVELARIQENELSGCCVRNDHSGCMQTTSQQCSPFLSTFYKWNRFETGKYLQIIYLNSFPYNVDMRRLVLATYTRS